MEMFVLNSNALLANVFVVRQNTLISPKYILNVPLCHLNISVSVQLT